MAVGLVGIVVALCTSGSKMITQMMVQNQLVAHYRKLERVKREPNNHYHLYLLTSSVSCCMELIFSKLISLK